jgi:hypothetical protein
MLETFRSIAQKKVSTTLCDIICDLWQVGGFLRVLNKTDHHDVTEILLKMALNTITLIIFHFIHFIGKYCILGYSYNFVIDNMFIL